ncbi:MAG: hypothetical protein K6348_07175 [Deferribacterales bacterium]
MLSSSYESNKHIDVIKNSDIFLPLSDFEKEYLLNKATLKRYKKGTVIVSQGDKPEKILK